MKNYAIFLYDERKQDFADTPIQVLPNWATAIEAAKGYTWWKLCEASTSGAVSRFGLRCPVADCLPEIT